jgi:hypothetical protein
VRGVKVWELKELEFEEGELNDGELNIKNSKKYIGNIAKTPITGVGFLMYFLLVLLFFFISVIIFFY